MPLERQLAQFAWYHYRSRWDSPAGRQWLREKFPRVVPIPGGRVERAS